MPFSRSSDFISFRLGSWLHVLNSGSLPTDSGFTNPYGNKSPFHSAFIGTFSDSCFSLLQNPMSVSPLLSTPGPRLVNKSLESDHVPHHPMLSLMKVFGTLFHKVQHFPVPGLHLVVHNSRLLSACESKGPDSYSPCLSSSTGWYLASQRRLLKNPILGSISMSNTPSR